MDDETYRQARIRAAQQSTSVSALVKEFLVKPDVANGADTTPFRESRDECAGVASGARAVLLARLQSEPVVEAGRWSRDELYPAVQTRDEQQGDAR